MFHPGYSTREGPVPVVPVDPGFETVWMAVNVFEESVIRGFGLTPADAVAVCLNQTEVFRLSRAEKAIDDAYAASVDSLPVPDSEEG